MHAVCRAVREARPDFQAADGHAERSVGGDRPAVQHWTFGNGGRAKVAEAFWGDLSLVRGTIPDMVRALCYNLYGAIHLSKSTLQGTSAITRLLPIIPFYLVRWVVLPMHILALGLALPLGFWLLTWPDPRSGDFMTSHNQAFLLLAVLYVAAGLAATLYMMRRQRHRVRPQPWDIAVAFTICALLSVPFGTVSVAQWFESCASTGSGTLGVRAIVKDIMAWRLDLNARLCDLVVASTPIEAKGEITGIGRYIAVNELAGDAAFYLCAAIVLIYILLVVGNMLLGRRTTARAMLLVAAICCLFVVTAAILLEVADFATRTVQFWGSPRYVAYWYEVIFVVWVAAVAVGAAITILVRRRRLLAQGRKHSARVAYSRVIVSPYFQMSVVTATLVLILSFLASEYIQESYNWLYSFKASYLLIAPVFLILLVGMVIFSSHLRLGLDIAMDIINHFVRSSGEFPVRRAISQRFYDTLDRLTADGERPHLLIVAHSQGSVITVDALVKDIWRKPFVAGRPPLSERVSSMTVLTFGSPVTHIYQHYFPTDYGPFSETSLNELAGDPRVRWLNIYREDDPVGTHIEGPTELFPENIAMAGGGHVRYWEKEIFAAAAVCQHLPGAEAP